MRALRRIGIVLWLAGWLTGVVEAQPHHEYTTQTKTATSTTAQTDTTLWTPATGKRFILQGVLVCATMSVRVELEVSDVDVIAPVYLDSYGCRTVDASGAALYMSATDAVLTYTTITTAHSPIYANVSVTAWGYEAQ